MTAYKLGGNKFSYNTISHYLTSTTGQQAALRDYKPVARSDLPLDLDQARLACGSSQARQGAQLTAPCCRTQSPPTRPSWRAAASAGCTWRTPWCTAPRARLLTGSAGPSSGGPSAPASSAGTAQTRCVRASLCCQACVRPPPLSACQSAGLRAPTRGLPCTGPAPQAQGARARTASAAWRSQRPAATSQAAPASGAPSQASRPAGQADLRADPAPPACRIATAVYASLPSGWEMLGSAISPIIDVRASNSATLGRLSMTAPIHVRPSWSGWQGCARASRSSLHALQLSHCAHDQPPLLHASGPPPCWAMG